MLVAGCLWNGSHNTSFALENPTQRASGAIAEFSGPTMGTRFTIKIFNPPNFEKDVRLEVDALLRRVNDLMSTYLKNSEISRFNRSESTDWFTVSKETVEVVSFAQRVSELTGGAFDITVGPLVNLWSFGPAERTQSLPDDKVISSILSEIGYQKLSVRKEPPALKKSLATLEIDLSSIAKGYAVDEVVKLLNTMGAENVFVEIGGEVGTSGNKEGQPWQVGIQVPDVRNEAVLLAQPLNTKAAFDQAMATSGDYRNFFEVEGVRYSHTIDPRTGKPIDHGLASVSVLGPSCMEADAWATALSVLGEGKGNQLAEEQGLSTLSVQRQQDTYLYVGTGLLADHAKELAKANASKEQNPESELQSQAVKDQQSSVPVIILTAVAFGAIVAGMAVGVMFGRRAISGSCGGLANRQDADGNTTCALCSNPSDACKELRDRMGQDQATESQQSPENHNGNS